ncbi:MAG TPA: Uma2 family endonuclease [Chthoniobacter sp.]|nr:Uma2 family endonuclease [Chthoniobacter sp.]
MRLLKARAHDKNAPAPIGNAHALQKAGAGRPFLLAFPAMAAVLNNPPASKHWTFADLAQFDESERYEIYDGRLISMATGPDFHHQEISGNLHLLLSGFVRPRQLGKLVYAPADVVLSEDNVVQPDLLFVAKENIGIIQKQVHGTPDLVVEILSTSTLRHDRQNKLELYARFGVKEYWIVDPANRSLEILVLEGKRFTVHSIAAETGLAESKVLSGLSIDVAQIFGE